MATRSSNGTSFENLPALVEMQNKLSLIGDCILPTIPIPFLAGHGARLGMRMCVNPEESSHTILEQTLMRLGSWPECDILIDIAKGLGSECKVIDVGANIGACLFGFLSLGLDVVAFEPNEGNLLRMETTLQTLRHVNGLGALDLRRNAVWNETKTIRFEEASHNTEVK
eukprot:TRINITY_DN11352_c0_g1_i3.p1 TRINITY_DN11352_c0_g1~~TRINITY_DN11352_c0_g1_i3.p1  ORF type:complete len:197 (+),score=24.04 TRINITY_DN11352_c0_g1_i3:85-591(+)